MPIGEHLPLNVFNIEMFLRRKFFLYYIYYYYNYKYQLSSDKKKMCVCVANL